MSETDAKKQTVNKGNRHAIILGIVGIVLVIIGVVIIAVPNVLRWSGLGTASLVAGIVILAIAVLRFLKKIKF